MHIQQIFSTINKYLPGYLLPDQSGLWQLCTQSRSHTHPWAGGTWKQCPLHGSSGDCPPCKRRWRKSCLPGQSQLGRKKNFKGLLLEYVSEYVREEEEGNHTENISGFLPLYDLDVPGAFGDLGDERVTFKTGNRKMVTSSLLFYMEILYLTLWLFLIFSV